MENNQKIILNELRKNPKNKIARICKHHNIPLKDSTIDYIDLRSNFITKFTWLVNFAKLGYPIHVHLKFKAQNPYKIKDIIRLNDFINSAYRLNDNNFYIECLFKNMNEYSTFREYLKDNDATDINVHHIIEDISREQFVF